MLIINIIDRNERLNKYKDSLDGLKRDEKNNTKKSIIYIEGLRD